MEINGFRTRQALADLARVPGVDRADRHGPDVLNVREEDALCAAAAEMLRSALATGKQNALISDLWATKADRLRRAPPPIRAALMNGVRLLRDLGLADEIVLPAPADHVTMPFDRVAPALIKIGRLMTADEMEHVARADYGCDVARHQEALAALLDDPALAYPEGDAWYPAEVIELVSHVPGQPGHVPCLAIVLLTALRTEDRHGDAEFRFAQQFDAIAALGPEVREPFFAAFRYLYESVPHWAPSVPPPFTLPWVSLP